MKNIVQKFTKQENRGVNAYSGRIFVKIACMFLSKHARSIGFALEPRCLTAAMLLLFFPCARQALRKKSKLDGKEQVCRSAKVYVKIMKATGLQSVQSSEKFRKGFLL